MHPATQSCLTKLLLFGKLDFSGQRHIAADMYERNVLAGEILIKEGDTGALQHLICAFEAVVQWMNLLSLQQMLCNPKILRVLSICANRVCT